MSWALGYIMDPKRMKEYAVEHQIPADDARCGDVFDVVLAEWARISGYPPCWERCVVGGALLPVFVLYSIYPKSVDDFLITAHKLGPRKSFNALIKALGIHERPRWYYVELDDEDLWAKSPSDLYDDELVRLVDEHMGAFCRVHRLPGCMKLD
jgi:hypothetical protein